MYEWYGGSSGAAEHLHLLEIGALAFEICLQD